MGDLASNLNLYLALLGGVLFLSAYASRISEKIGVPLLLVFLGIGMLLGSEGIGGIEFSNALLAQIVGTIALVFILYSGGLNTHWKEIKPVLRSGILLATLGVLLTTFIMALCIYYMLDFSFLESLLLGAIVSSTDAAAVFMVLRSSKIKLKNNIDYLLELESGSNDPMAIFLTITILQMIVIPNEASILEWIIQFFAQFIVGGILGVVCGYLFPKICSKVKITQAGLYPLLSLAWLLIVFGVSSLLYGNGYLSIYIAGILTNKYAFPHKENIIAFHDSSAWIMQIVVFLVLGLLVFPSELSSVTFQAVVLSAVLILIARPLSVFVSLYKSPYDIKEKVFISWVGLRGAVPIILATYPYAYHLEVSSMFFNIVFFAVIISVLLQGMSLKFVAKILKISK
ncbi:potassium/proton antiporter [Helicobacter burdigaliensis]